MLVCGACETAIRHPLTFQHSEGKVCGNRLHTFRYTDALATNWERRKATLEKWNFACKCERCEDITEFKTHTSGVVCCQCDIGTLLIDTTDKKWSCNRCRYSSSHSEVWLTMLDPLGTIHK